MPRYPRAFLRGHPHHIVQRGHDRQPVFAAPDDCEFYLENLREQCELLDLSLFSYCLMTNHVHLLVQPERAGEDISRLMRVLAARQTRYTNRLDSRTGTLWEGRFKCSIVDTDVYLLACCRYIDLNPVRAGIVPSPELYRWSGYAARAGLRASEVALAPLQALGHFQAARAAAYVTLVRSSPPAPVDELITIAVQRNQLTGGDCFREAIAAKLGRRISNDGPGRPRKKLAQNRSSGK